MRLIVSALACVGVRGLSVALGEPPQDSAAAAPAAAAPAPAATVAIPRGVRIRGDPAGNARRVGRQPG
jgi:hypothetical protein